MDTKSIKNKFLRDIGIFILSILVISFNISLNKTIDKYKEFKNTYKDNFYDENSVRSSFEFFNTVLKDYINLYKDLDGNKKADVYNKELENSKLAKEEAIKEAEANIRSIFNNLSEEEIKSKIEESRKIIMEEDDSVDQHFNYIYENTKNTLYGNVNIEFFFKDSSGAKITNINDSNIEKQIEENNFINNEDYYYMYFPKSKVRDNKSFYSVELANLYNYLDYSDDNLVRYYRIPKELKVGDALYDSFAEREANVSSINKKIGITTFIGSIVIVLALIIFKKRKNKDISFVESVYVKIPIDIRFIIFMISLITFNDLLKNVIPYYSYTEYCNLVILKSAIYILLDYYFLKDIVLILNNQRNIGNLLILKLYKYIFSVLKNNEAIKTNKFKSIFIISLSVIAVFCLWLESFAYWSYGLMIFSRAYLCIYILLSSILSVIIFREISIVESNTLKIAKGNYRNNLKDNKMVILKSIENNLITIEDGLKEALDKAITSEKMKSELITNVSHDLKTPLTSIINYIDLLKEEDITDEKRKKYLEVLDMKSKRLKILIEDLFEASKAVSGNMNFMKEDLNIVSLLRQVIGELEEKISQANLNIITKWPEEKAILCLDGRKTFRVYENLINNIIKYSMKNSRVYIDVINNEDDVIVVMKNISAYQIDFKAEEVIERFKRGDQSRSTEGSGLGLSIAKSIVELQGGDFKIEIDGDLFKVITRFNKINK
ncbi:sensor histidine kinase [Clostridium nigeriense]|uniref:sensor histidine kinase n=1 Tax=Clostridium nigeriense TaxID=1805470 RepID=UPI003D326409